MLENGSFKGEYDPDLERIHILFCFNSNFSKYVGGERLRNEITNKFAWHHYFTSIIGSGDAIEDKPSMHPAKLALHGSGIMDYSNVWLIGDSSVDLKTAQNLGCKAILFGNNTQADNIPFYLSVANHQELLKLLENIYV